MDTSDKFKTLVVAAALLTRLALDIAVVVVGIVLASAFLR